MAEAIGLAFGGIALTGLVSSCVDLLEYTNSARYWIYDLSLALTKVALLQYRLGHLNDLYEAAQANGGDKSGNFTGSLSYKIECDIATQGLSGVKSVLEQTNKLCRKYSLAHMEEGEHYSAHRSQSLQSSASAATNFDQQQLAVAFKPWRRLGRQLSWALQDKKKFDKLILDLDFFLSNTEQLFQKAPLTTIQACQPQLPASTLRNTSNICTFFQLTNLYIKAVLLTDWLPCSEAGLCATAEDAEQGFAETPLPALNSCPRTSGDTMSSGDRDNKKPAANTPLRRAGLSERAAKTESSVTDSRVAVVQSTVSMTTSDSNNTYARNDFREESYVVINSQDKDGRQEGAIVIDNKFAGGSSITVGSVHPKTLKIEELRLQVELARLNRKD